MRWRRRNSAPNNRFIVPIIDDEIPEPIEKLEIFVECDASENCYLPRQSYTITIIDDQGTYSYHAITKVIVRICVRPYNHYN